MEENWVETVTQSYTKQIEVSARQTVQFSAHVRPSTSVWSDRPPNSPGYQIFTPNSTNLPAKLVHKQWMSLVDALRPDVNPIRPRRPTTMMRDFYTWRRAFRWLIHWILSSRECTFAPGNEHPQFPPTPTLFLYILWEATRAWVVSTASSVHQCECVCACVCVLGC